MRILLAQNSPYYPAHGGGDKSNRLLLEALAERGHTCRVVARAAAYGPEAHQQYLLELARRSVHPSSTDVGVVVFNLRTVTVHVVTSHANLRAYFAEQVASFHPDVILTSTDDPAQLLLEVALRAESTRVAYLARATLALPFGPDCAFPSTVKTQALRGVDTVVGVSQYVANYIRRWSGIEAVHVPISLMEPGPYSCLGRFDNEFVTLVNPCAVKGISIFLALAERMPDVRFAGVPTWGTSEQDRAALKKHPNIHILDPVDDIDQVLVRTRVLLVPSLWAEARSRIVVEAMLRGIPVLASNVGGIAEAKMEVDYLLPVRPIAKYHPRLDEQMVPLAEVPEQDVEPWYEALRRLLSDPMHYKALSKASREAALSYAGKLSARPFESLLEDVVRRPKRISPVAEPAAPLQKLSPDKRKLLALRLRQKTPAVGPSAWFPSLTLKPGAKLRLFCFPYAGGGAAVFHTWADSLPGAVSLCPVRLPGRESRLAEPPFQHMDALVEALSAAIIPYLATPFAFFGHSMGAAIAFELARSLRKQNQPLPVGLFVSGARAPQLRLGHVPPPEPTESELLDELRRLEGIPRQVLQNDELLRVVLPALRADAALYRNYVYVEERPLDCHIRAYGGVNDPNLRREHLEAWRKQSARSFSLQMLEGGHFFIFTAKPRFLEALSGDLEEIA